MAVVVSSTSVEKKLSPFVPSNPMSGIITGMFLEEDTADVRFEVSSSSGDEASSASAVTFHAHFLILKKCAPMLASLFDSGKKIAPVFDVEPAIFHHMLHTSTGGTLQRKSSSLTPKKSSMLLIGTPSSI